MLLIGLTKQVTEIFLSGLQKSPFDARELQKHIDEMTAVKDEANEDKRILWDEFQKVVDLSQTDHHKLTKHLTKNTEHIQARLEELRNVRLKAQARVHRQVEDDNGPHKIKLSRMERDVEKTIQMSRVRNNQVIVQSSMLMLLNHLIIQSIYHLKPKIFVALSRRERNCEEYKRGQKVTRRTRNCHSGALC